MEKEKTIKESWRLFSFIRSKLDDANLVPLARFNFVIELNTITFRLNCMFSVLLVDWRSLKKKLWLSLFMLFNICFTLFVGHFSCFYLLVCNKFHHCGFIKRAQFLFVCENLKTLINSIYGRFEMFANEHLSTKNNLVGKWTNIIPYQKKVNIDFILLNTNEPIQPIKF